jgi:hypothetical protein
MGESDKDGEDYDRPDTGKPVKVTAQASESREIPLFFQIL